MSSSTASQVTHGRGGRIRTDGPSLPKRVRYQAALHPVVASLGAAGVDRGGAAASRSSVRASQSRPRTMWSSSRASIWSTAFCALSIPDSFGSMGSDLPIVTMKGRPPGGVGWVSRQPDRSSRSVKTASAAPSAHREGDGEGVRYGGAGPRGSRGRSSMVEPQSSKLATRVRFPSPAPHHHRRSGRSRGRRAARRPRAPAPWRREPRVTQTSRVATSTARFHVVRRGGCRRRRQRSSAR